MDNSNAERLFRLFAWGTRDEKNGSISILQSASALVMLDNTTPFEVRMQAILKLFRIAHKSLARRNTSKDTVNGETRIERNEEDGEQDEKEKQEQEGDRLTSDEARRLLWCTFIPAARAASALHVRATGAPGSIMRARLEEIYKDDFRVMGKAIEAFLARIFSIDGLQDPESGTVAFSTVVNQMRFADGWNEVSWVHLWSNEHVALVANGYYGLESGQDESSSLEHIEDEIPASWARLLIGHESVQVRGADKTLEDEKREEALRKAHRERRMREKEEEKRRQAIAAKLAAEREQERKERVEKMRIEEALSRRREEIDKKEAQDRAMLAKSLKEKRDKAYHAVEDKIAFTVQLVDDHLHRVGKHSDADMRAAFSYADSNLDGKLSRSEPKVAMSPRKRSHAA